MSLASAFFYLFAAVTVGSALLVISARNPVHSVLFLILAFVNAAGLFLLMGAEFLAMSLIVVFVGAVAVLFLFVLGVLGIFINRKNVIVILMSIELILLAVNINLVAFSAFLGDLVGQVFAMFVLTVAAGEAAIGLAILVLYFRNRGTIAVDDINMMRG